MKHLLLKSLLKEYVANPGTLAKWMEPRVDRSKTRLLLAAAPKSGSTYLTKLLSSVLGWKVRDAAGAFGRSEQQIYLPRLTSALDEDTLIGHQHLKANEATIRVMRLFHFKTIVLVRDFSDSVVSMREHHLRESTVHPMAMVERSQLEPMSQHQHLWFVIRMVMPWYFSFYASWKVASRDETLDIHWVTYQQLIDDPHRIVDGILKFAGIHRSGQEIDKAILDVQGMNTRRNVGVAGRGATMLDPEQQAALCEMASFYPDIDFSEVGLAPEKPQASDA